MRPGDVIRYVGRSAGRGSSTWRLKKILASAMVVGAASYLTVGGVFAAFNADAKNRGGLVATGTLTFSNQVGTATACNSHAGPASPGNVNSSCDALVSSSPLRYPGASTTVHVTIKNTGSLDANDLSVYMPTCTATQSPGATAAGVSYSGDPCGTGGLMFTIQETDSTFTTNQTCWFPTAGTTCSFAANSLRSFAVNENAVTTALDLGAGPAAGGSRYFVIGLELPSTASSLLQGREADFDLTWHVST